jgi:hypothetical protein
MNLRLIHLRFMKLCLIRFAHETVFDSPSVHETVFDSPSVHETVFDSPSVHETVFSLTGSRPALWAGSFIFRLI